MKVSETIGASPSGVVAVSADAEGADTGVVNVVISSLSAQVYTVLTEAEVSVAVVVYPAAVKVVVCVITTVMGSALVLVAALGVHVVPRSLEVMVNPRGVIRLVEELDG